MRDEGAVASLSSNDGQAEQDAWSNDAASPPSAGVDRASPFAENSKLLPRLLQSLGITPADIAAARLAARLHGSDLGTELVCARAVSEEDLARGIAAALLVGNDAIRPTDAVIDEDPAYTRKQLGCAKALQTCGQHMHAKLFLAPRLEELDALQTTLARHRELGANLHIATPRAIDRRRALASAKARSDAACLSLAGRSPALSARQVMTGTQGFFAAFLFAAVGILAWQAANALLLALHLVATPLFLCGIYWRLSAAMTGHLTPRSPLPQGESALQPLPCPVYTVLVALHREVEMVPGLVAALSALRWPRSRLEILLVCEADDLPTISAVQTAMADQPGFDIVLVPPTEPRTKPKALNVALPLATGEFLVLYDAEDRPHPDQLEAAWHAFRRGGERLVCLQAPLVVGNGERTWFSGHFALEYAALFRGLLPWLARKGLPLPLGGTSNHFRRAALVGVGGWDSHNVTEDADLGIRLARNGFSVGTLDVPTFEDGPELWAIWLKQRTRWMKGWLQTCTISTYLVDKQR